MGRRAAEETLPDGLVDAIGGEAYLRNRPSFVRLAARCQKLAGHKLTRAQYGLLRLPVRKLKTLLKLTDTNTEQFEVVHQTVNAWGDGNWQVKAQLKPKKGQAPELVPATPVAYAVSSTKPRSTAMQVLAIPDMHFGYFDPGGSVLESLHDERCAAVMLAIAREYQPATIVVLGDLLDLAPFSRFVVDPRYTRVSQHAIQAAYGFLAGLRAAAPRAKIVMLEGNHEARIAKHLSQQAPEVVGLTRAENEGETGVPVLSVPYLLRLEDLRIDYVGPYGRSWWWDGVRYMHGELIGSSGGLTAAKLLAAYHEPVVCGHVHRAELAWRTTASADGVRHHWAMSCGTGARLDGVVPGHAHPDWQHAIGVVWFGCQPGVYVIRDGVCSLDGRLFAAEEAG